MLSSFIYLPKNPKEHTFSASKKISLTDITFLFSLTVKEPNLGSILEKAIIDILLGEKNTFPDAYTHVWYVLEKINKFLRDVGKEYDLSLCHIFIGAIDGEVLHFSLFGDIHVLLTQNNRVLDLSEDMKANSGEFSYIKSGPLGSNEGIYISHNTLGDYLSEDDLTEIARIQDNARRSEAFETLISREIKTQDGDILLIRNEREGITEQNTTHSFVLQAQKVWGRVKVFSTPYLERFFEHPKVKESITSLKGFFLRQSKGLRISLFTAGVVVSLLLLFGIIQSLFNPLSNPFVPEEYKNKLIEAELILSKVGKDLGNREAFDLNIKRAETIIYEVREKQLFSEDVKKLLDLVSILKKEINGITSFNPTKDQTEYVFDPKDTMNLLGIFESGKKLYFVGNNKIIGPYIKGAEVKTYDLPDKEEGISADISQDGIIYVLTKTNRVIAFNRGAFEYINVDGQRVWEPWVSIRSFNANIYILAKDHGQIFKHKPSINGFGPKTTLLPSEDVKTQSILDFGIDGSFYILNSDALKIDKIFTTPIYARRSLMINKLPDGYSLQSQTLPRLFASQNFVFVYLLVNDKIWILEPDSKDFRNVKSLRYVGQIELGSEPVETVYIPKDGTLYIGTKTAVYKIDYEVTAGKIIIR